ncbi:MAG TPA: single-stranded DNA-binding protein [Clostridia bacterium]
MNRVILIGNLTRDPELSQTPGGIPYCRMSIAVNRNYTNADGERLTDFFNIIAWRGLAENCHKYLRKGHKVGVCGYLQTRSYEQDGVKRYITEIVADEVEFLTPKSAQDPFGESRKSIQDIPPIEDDDLPF